MSPIDQVLATGRKGRQMSGAYVLYRLNQSRCERNYVDTVHKCKFCDEGSNHSIVCYPLRISNVDLGVEDPTAIVAGLHDFASSEGWGDIAMISFIHEADSTLTVDIGFTDLEDALAMWSKDGRKHRDRHWDIQPITGVLGTCFIFRDPTSPKPLSWRLERLSACEAWEQAMHPNQNESSLLKQLRKTISQLTTANGLSSIPAAHLPPGASLYDLYDGPHLRRLVGIQPLMTQLYPPVMDRMYSGIQVTPHHWSSISIHTLSQSHAFE
jgi:hypothetical protein